MAQLRAGALTLSLSLLGGLVLLAGPAAAAPCDPPNNEVVCENSKAGTPSGVWDVDGAGDSSIQGYSTEISVDQGETIEFKVDTASDDYRLDIYRMGWYGGDGARKVGTVEPPPGTLPQSQPSCDLEPSTGLVDCGEWAVSASWEVPADAVSGIYFAKLEREDASSEGSHIVFVVRDDDGESDLLFQTSDTTWQAYNEYGSNSLYTGGPGSSPSRAYKVSYNRPLTVRGTNPEDGPFNAEYPMVRWLERNGYDVSYLAGADTDRAGEELLEHEAFLSVGHDEYWSAAQRENVEAARDAGVDLAFFSGNEIFWKTRWEASIDAEEVEYRTLVCYKETHAGGQIDPEGPDTWTGTWRDPRFSPPGDGGRPENELSGTAFMVNAGTTEIEVPAADGAMRFWRDTDIAELEPGETATLGDSTLGYEWDEDLDNGFRPDGLVRLSSTVEEVPQKLLDHGNTYGEGTAEHHLTLYRAESGALVFGAGTIQWSWGLDPEHDRGNAPADARMQQATANLFADMGVQPGTLQAGLAPATGTSDELPPNTTIATPADEGEVELDEAVTISGTAADSVGESEAGGEVGAVEVSVDGGETWRPAEGRGDWTFTWFPEELGEATVLARAADDSGNLEDTPDEIAVDVVPLTCPCSIWNDTVTGSQDPDTNAVEVGVKFRSEIAGFITGLRFYKTIGNEGTHEGHLWTAAGEQLAAVTFTGETATGWQQASFDTPVPIDAGTTYVAAYHAPNGRYASIKSYFAASGFENPPLYALADDEDGPNGIYQYGAAGGLFSGEPQTFQSENYLVDVVFELDVGPDTTPPQVNSRSPVDGAEGIGVDTPVRATFDEAIDPGTVSGATVQLREGESAPVAASVSYDSLLRRVTLDPSASLSPDTTYTATIEGGPGGVADVAGNPLAADEEWSFTTAPPPPPPPDQGPGGPILAISHASDPFSRYYGQILEAEGLNQYSVAEISTVTPAVLEERDVAILGEGPVSPAQAQMLSEWVQDGGNLIAMRPDPDLLDLLGLSAPEGALAEGYIEVDTGAAPGAGIVGETIQFHGTADRYTAEDAQTIATLFSDASTSTGDPAVTLRSVGPNGGHAAAFTYDLARSVVYTRQGNPAWAGEERDGLGAIRSDDLFFGAKAGDEQPDWIDFDKVDIPQADEQQRLLTNLIGEVNLDRKPLPRFWFLPRDEKAAVVMTGDDHANNGTVGRFEEQKALDPPGCAVAEWECVRSTSYIYPNTPISDSEAAQLAGEGFELALHVTTGCNDWDDEAELGEFYDEQLGEFAVSFPSLPAPATNRTHCIVWSDWAGQPKVELERGIRLDTTYYYWPASWVQNRPGMFTGSGMPMRFADTDGSLIDVYQAATQMTDESEQSYPFTSDALLDRALGSEGYYGVFTANMHTDLATLPESTAIVESAQARDVPVVSARQMLTWLDGRNQSSFGSVEWEDDQLEFEIDRGSGANGLRAMVPTSSAVGPLVTVEREGSPVGTTTRTVKGVEYAFFDAEAGSYTASYVDESLPEISGVEATGGNDGTATVSWQTDEPADSRVDYGTNSASLELSASDPALVTSHSIQLTGLDPESIYHFRVSSADAEANLATEPEALLPPQSFATPPAAPVLNATEPPSPANENSPAVLGTAAAGATVEIFAGPECTGSPLAAGSAEALEAGIAVAVADDSTTELRATATSTAGSSICSEPLVYVEDSVAPTTQIDLGPPGLSDSATATFQLSGDDGLGSGVASFECKLDQAGFEPCPSEVEYTDLAEGGHVLEVRAVDHAGNVDQSAAEHEWTVDSKAPETEITGQPPAFDSSATADFTFTGTDPEGSGVASFECRLDEGGFEPCSSGIEYTDLAEGAHAFEARTVDQAGNKDGEPAKHEWTVDLTPPAVSVQAGPEGLTDNPTPTFEFGSEPGATFECSIDSGTADFGPCSGAAEHTPGEPLADGPYTFRVRATDEAGNPAVATRSFDLDATAPETQITANPAPLVSSAKAEFAFSGDDGAGSGIASFECSLDGEPFGICSSGIELAELAEGPHSFEVRATDNAGNVDGSPAKHEWEIDLTAPEVTIDSLSKALLKAAETSELTWHGDENGAFELRAGGTDCDTGAVLDSGPYSTQPATEASQVTAAQLAEGASTLRLCLTDAAGNRGEATTTIEKDTEAPETQIDDPPGPLLNATTATFAFSGSDPGGSGIASFECKLDDGGFEPCSSDTEYTELAEGPHSFEVRAIDNAGNVDQSAAKHEWTVDSKAPETEITGQPPAFDSSATANFTFTGADPEGSGVASFECRRDSEESEDWQPCTSPLKYTSLAQGPHRVEVRAIDQAGNVDESVAAHEWTIDSNAPETQITLGPAALESSDEATFEFTGSDPGGSGVASFECRRDSEDPEAWTVCTSPHTYADLLDGAHEFEVRAVDQAGNVDGSAASHEWTVDTTPPALSIDSGPEGLTTDPVPAFGFVYSPEPGDTLECSIDGGEAEFEPCATAASHGAAEPLANGPYTFRVRATDEAGNASLATRDFEVDATVPETEIAEGPAPLVGSDEASFEFTGEDPEGIGVTSFQCRIDSEEPGAWTGCESPRSYASLADGPHTFEVRAIDGAGNTDQSAASHEWTVDTVAPETEITTMPPALADSANAEFEFSGDDGAGSGVVSFECSLDGGGFEACDSGVVLSELPEGPHSFEVRAIDGAGNVDGSAAKHEWEIDSKAPETQIDESPPELSGSAKATFEFSGEDPGGSGVASFQCRRDSDEEIGWQLCASPRVYTSLAEGVHTFEVRAIDGAGSPDPTPATFEWEIDTKAPQTQITVEPAALTGSDSATFEFAGDDADGSGVASFECSLDEAAFGACETNIELTGLSEGPHTFEVRAIDNAGNADPSAAKHEWTVDLTPPAVSVQGGPEGLTDDATPTFQFGSEPDASFECSIDSGTADFGPCSGAAEHAPESPLADGPHTFRVRATDEAGNPATATRAFEVDATSPDTELTLGPAALLNSPTATFQFSGDDGTGSGVASFECSLDEAAFGACETNIELTGLSEGPHTFEVRAIDNAGNADGSAAKHEWEIDLTPPAVSVSSGPEGLTSNASPTFGFGSEPDASFECSIDSGTAAFGPCSGAAEHTPVEPLVDGPYTFRVRASDEAGNAMVATREFEVDAAAPPAPQLSATVPASPANHNTPKATGTAQAGTTVRIYDTADCTGTPLVTASATELEAGVAVPVADNSTTELRATATASPGNTSLCSDEPLVYIEDSQAPNTQIGAAPEALVNSATAELGFSGEDPGGSGVASFQCRVDSDGPDDWVVCDSPRELTELVEGAHSFEVKAIDGAGNIDPTAATHEWEIDLTPPAVSVDSGPEGLTGNATPTFDFGSEPGASFECSIDSGTADFGPCLGAGEHAAESPLADGPHTFRVRASDEAGNQATATRDFQLDATAPATAITLQPAGLESSDEATFEFSGDDGGGSGVAAFECSLDEAGFGECDSGIELTGLSEGDHKFEVRAVDNAANVDQTAAIHEWTVDTAAPQTQITDQPPAFANSPSATFEFEGDDGAGSGVASFQCSLDEAGFSACEPGIVVSELAEGPHVFEVRAIDTAGNVDASAAKHEWEVDTEAPETTIDTAPPSPLNSDEATFEFSGDDGAGSGIASFQCNLDEAGFSACDSGIALTELSEGPHSFEVRAIDTAGNVDASAAKHEWTVDLTAPVATIDSLSKALLKAGETSELTWHGDENGAFELRAGGADCDTGAVLDSGAYGTQPEAKLANVAAAQLAEGENTLRLCLTDAAGNRGAATAAIVKDTEAPDASIDEAPDPLVNTTTATFAFTGSDPDGSGIASFECKLDDGAFEGCESGIESTELSEGAHIFEVRAIDNAGNIGAPASHEWTVDTTPPALSIQTGPEGLTNNASPIFAFDVEPGADVLCSIDDGEADFEQCSASEAHTPDDPLGDGDYTFRVRATDQAGNQVAATRDFQLDATAPEVEITGDPPELTSSDEATFQFSGDDGGSGIASFQCRLDEGGFENCDSGIELTELAEGAHSFEVRAIDNAGNTGDPAIHEWTVDTAAPTAQIGAKPDALDNSAIATFGFSGDDGTGSGIASFECKLDDGSFEECESGVELTGLSEGPHTFEVRAIDNADNTGSPASHEWTVDTTPPALSIQTGPEGLTNNASPTFAFDVEEGATVECSIDQGTPEFGPCSEGSSHTPEAPLGDGPHTFRVRATDEAGNPATATRDFEVDTALPEAPELEGTAPPSPANHNTPLISGSAEPGATVRLYTGPNCDGDPIAAITPAELEAGVEATVPDDSTTTFRATATTAAENASGCSAPLVYVEDSTAPDTTIDTAPPALVSVATATFDLSGSDPDGSGVASLECKLDDGSFSACESSIELTGLSEGAHKLEVRAIDNAGNTDQNAASHEWTVDTVAPSAQIDTAPAALVNSATATFAFSGDDGAGSGIASFECKLDDGDFDACGSGVELTGLSEGDHSFEVRAIDNAGNSGAPASHEWAVDTVAPTAQIDKAPPAIASSAKATFEFTGDDGAGSGVASFQCRRDSDEPSGWQLCESPRVYTSLADSDHSFEVRAIDEAENVGDPATYEWTIDTVAPDTQITTKPPALVKSDAASFAFTGSDPDGSGIASFECKLDDGSFSACESSIELTGLSEGDHKLEVRAIDNAGNTDQSAASHEWTVDTVAPSAQIDTAPPALVGVATAEFAFSGSDAGGSGLEGFQCRRDSEDPEAWAACASPHDYAELADGPHTFEVRAIDNAGNTGSPASHDWTVDTTPPALSIQTGPEGLTNNHSPTFAFDTEEGASAQCSIDQGTPAFGSCSDGSSHTPDAPLEDGPYTFRVRATDAAENQATRTRDFEVDTALPPAPVLDATVPPSPANENAPLIKGSAEGTTVHLYTGADCDGEAIATITPAELEAGVEVAVANDSTTTFRATATTAAENASGCSAPLVYVEDSTAPDTTIDTAPAALVNSATATFAFSGDDGAGSGVASFQCKLDSGSFEGCNSGIELDELAEGPHTFEVRAIDNASNIGDPAIHEWTVDTAAPTAQVDLGPEPISDSADASFAFSGSDPDGSGVASFECRRDGGGWSSCSSTKDYSALAEGPHKFEVRAIDEAENVGDPATYEWEIDTKAPDTTIDTAPVALVSSATASFEFSGSDPDGSGVASFECKLDDGSFEACESSIELTELSEGDHRLEVRAIDNAGNTDQSAASHEWEVDLTDPTVSVDSGPEGLTNDTVPAFGFSAEGTVECSIDDGTADFGPCSDDGSHTPDAPLPDGEHTFRVRATDAAGNQAVETRDFQLDATAPTTAITLKPPALAGSDEAVFEFSGDDGAGSGIASFQCKLDDGGFGVCESGIELTGLSDGSHSFEVRATDDAGNGGGPVAYEWVIDTEEPETAIESGPAGTSDSADAALAFSGSDGARPAPESFQCRLDSVEATAWSSCDSPTAYVGLADGPHTFEVRAIDGAGNADSTPAVRSWAIDTSEPSDDGDDDEPDPEPSSAAAPAPAPEPVEPVEPQFVRVVNNARKGTAALVFVLPGPGVLSAKAPAFAVPSAKNAKSSSARRALKRQRLRILQRSIRPRNVRVGAPGRAAVPVVLSKAGTRLLRRRGRLKVGVVVRYHSAAGPQAKVWKLAVTLKKRKGGGGKAAKRKAKSKARRGKNGQRRKR